MYFGARHRVRSLFNERNIDMDNERYLRGWAKLKEVDGQAGENVIESLRDIAPDFARLIIEFPFGDIYSRPGLDLKTRELAVVAALTAMGNAVPQLKVRPQRRLLRAGDRRSHHANGRLCWLPCCTQRAVCSKGGLCTSERSRTSFSFWRLERALHHESLFITSL